MRTSNRLHILTLCVALSAAGCTKDDTELPSQDGSNEEVDLSFPVERQQVSGGGEMTSVTPVSLCEMAAVSNLIGEFTVDRIVSDIGDDPFGVRQEQGPITRVSFVGEVWQGADPSPVSVLMRGGVRLDGIEQPTQVGFRVGEAVLLFLEGKWDNGEWAVGEHQVFRPAAHGGFTNGHVLGIDPYTPKQIKHRITADPCQDVPTDDDLRRAASDDDVGVQQGPVEYEEWTVVDAD